jgi:hypothetical protein
VAADPELYGAYFRPRLPDLLEAEPDAISGADEFSPLVEAMLAPALALAQLEGGLIRVYQRWLPWIRGRNAARSAGSHRLGYGSPLDFADFLLETLLARKVVPAAAVAAARLLRTNLLATQPAQATTMANHRSLPDAGAVQELELGTELTPSAVLAILALEFEATSVLSGGTECDFPRSPTHYVWHANARGSVRLLEVSKEIYDLLAALLAGKRSVADLIVSDLDVRTAAGRAPGDSRRIMESADAAIRHGLVTVGG